MINNIDPGYTLKPVFDLIENYGVCPDHYNLRTNFRVILIQITQPFNGALAVIYDYSLLREDMFRQKFPQYYKLNLFLIYNAVNFLLIILIGAGSVTKYLNIVPENGTFIFIVNKYVSYVICCLQLIRNGCTSKSQNISTFKRMISKKLTCRTDNYYFLLPNQKPFANAIIIK